MEGFITISLRNESCLPAFPMTLRAGMGGAPFLFGRRGTEDKEVTTAPVMATAAVSTLSLLVAALCVEPSQNTLSCAPPHWRQRTLVGRQRTR